MKILVIEDEVKLGQFLGEGLAEAGHVCDHFMDGAGGLEAARGAEYELIILDLMLPDMNGFEILTNLRESRHPTPVLVLSALGDTDKVIQALDLGAIDYMRKPFDFDEMLARIRTIQRRGGNQSGYQLSVGDLQLNLLSREVSRSGVRINLSNREFALLEFLLTHSNQVVTKAQILDKIWDINFDPGSNIVEVHMYQLRKKIDKDTLEPLIQTVIGRGYLLKGEVIKS
ncbi:response regulator transcription factor [Puia sp.]|jgi:DNA-binding response OmpR family regulator|uniref:response regulator transcription factor n=1 Tax=Puia sp. TaxID=2045100 RepID=UPI002F428AE6